MFFFSCNFLNFCPNIIGIILKIFLYLFQCIRNQMNNRVLNLQLKNGFLLKYHARTIYLNTFNHNRKEKSYVEAVKVVVVVRLLNTLNK